MRIMPDIARYEPYFAIFSPSKVSRKMTQESDAQLHSASIYHHTASNSRQLGQMHICCYLADRGQ